MEAAALIPALSLTTMLLRQTFLSLLSCFHGFSSVFHIIISFSALGAKELILQFCGLLIYFICSGLLISEEKNEHVYLLHVDYMYYMHVDYIR